MARIGLIIQKTTTIDGKMYRAQDFIELEEAAARALVNSGVANRADGGPAEQRRMVDADGHEVRLFPAEVKVKDSRK